MLAKFEAAQEASDTAAEDFVDERTVEGNAVTTSSVDGNLSHSGRLSVANMFDRVDAAIENPATMVKPIYDEALGYPVSYWIDHEDLVPDQESGLEVLSLKSK